MPKNTSAIDEKQRHNRARHAGCQPLLTFRLSSLRFSSVSCSKASALTIPFRWQSSRRAVRRILPAATFSRLSAALTLSGNFRRELSREIAERYGGSCENDAALSDRDKRVKNCTETSEYRFVRPLPHFRGISVYTLRWLTLEVRREVIGRPRHTFILLLTSFHSVICFDRNIRYSLMKC